MKHGTTSDVPATASTAVSTGGAATAASSADAVAALAASYGLGPRQREALGRLLKLLVEDPAAPTAVTGARAVVAVHLADSLSALVLEEVTLAQSIVDLGSGAGLPGLPLAIALPSASVVLLESNGRKCAFLENAISAVGAPNASVAHQRAESWSSGHGQHDLVTARAVAPLPVLCEYAAPLLRLGGALVAWKAALTAAESRAGAIAAALVGLEPPRQVRTAPYPQSERHQLVVFRKSSATPSRFPRRPGMARKRPLAA